METTPPFQVVTGQRQLAVIMFTDAVGYSAKMHAEEVATLNLLERDMLLMRQEIGDRGGTVLKSTGDGLLVQFSSAVQAVSCAVEIQRRFADRLVPGQQAKGLRHRISVHLGDVFAGGGDVLGDGVNIAARLLTTAAPGGISISQTVYDVVKNKLELHVTRQGPRQLKNIAEPVPVYHVLLDAPRLPSPLASRSSDPGTTATPTASSGPGPWRGLSLIAAGIACIGAGVYYLWEQHTTYQRELGQSQAAQAALGALLEQKGSGPPPPAVPPPKETTAAEPDFARLARIPGTATAAELAAARPRAQELADRLQAWLPGALARYTRERPLVLRALGPGTFRATSVFTSADGRLHFAEGGAMRERSWAELRPDTQAAVIASVLLDAPAPVPAEIRRGAEAFAFLHGLPELAEALGRVRG